DPQRAVLAAAEALVVIKELGRSRGHQLFGRAGVNTGIVIAGAIGSGKVRNYTVMGSAVNLASRLEEAAGPDEVWVGPETYEATRHRLFYEPTGEIELNGFPTVREAYRLVAPPAQPEADPFSHLSFVGRDEELTRLFAALDTVTATGGATELWIAGEAGRGKSRLLREFFSRAESRAITLWLELTPASEFSWDPLARQVFGIQPSQDEQQAVQQARTVLDAVL